MVGVTPKHVRRAIKAEALTCCNVGIGSRPLYRISREDVMVWMSPVKVAPSKKERLDLVKKYFG